MKSGSVRLIFATFFTLFTMHAIADRVFGGNNQFSDQITPLQAPPPLEERKLALGARLFADPIMSGKGRLSCSSCHDLSTSGTVNLKRTIGYNGAVHNFNAPTIFNVANNYRLGWRGNFTSLAAQNEQVLLDSNIMSNDWASLLGRLKGSSDYSKAFRLIYGGEPSKESVLDVLVTFQLSLATPNARFDRFLLGEKDALSDSEKAGYDLFQNIGCIACHQGSNIGGNLFQKFGVFEHPPGGDDGNPGNLGRYTITHQDADKQYFRVPSLRNVAVTGPYFHDGRAASLEEAVQVMAKTQVGQDISREDIHALVEFLGTLTGEYRGVRLREGPIPQDGAMPRDR
ncbi:c-type cytochrome [Rhizobium ruizarguesonis]|uniref:cytochrome-c peroxidase n=1 Tax=Rhizobium TaxID=379 RepID=UPI00102FAD0A|nr:MULTISPECIES: cytochrome c peroxidase [Rhizobium]QND16932.1 c-type cytochrome [Rhizobium leguminosarum bv. trifolii]TCA20353.1 c-type cytochrome [Rhizobium leguminosarum bv. viciae]NEH75656.1 c-type cytochrome [Rhizobium ruizarguesonis]NEI05361.1 c-type cytochrome [Rhizobium ruizarguesonis]NEI11075.1 c-type cytochrome [Rhizobium ruizarguesonis]